MLVRKLRYYRMKSGKSLKILSKELVVSYYGLFNIETCVSKIRPSEAKYLSEFFNTTPEEISKIIDLDIVGKSISESRCVINREDVPQEEIDQFFKKMRSDNCKRVKQFKIRRVENIRKANKVTNSFKCLNQACLLNKNCMCDNPVVIRGDAPCYGRDKVKSKNANTSVENPYALFQYGNQIR